MVNNFVNSFAMFWW